MDEEQFLAFSEMSREDQIKYLKDMEIDDFTVLQAAIENMKRAVISAFQDLVEPLQEFAKAMQVLYQDEAFQEAMRQLVAEEDLEEE